MVVPGQLLMPHGREKNAKVNLEIDMSRKSVPQNDRQTSITFSERLKA